MCVLPTCKVDLSTWQQEEETFTFSLDEDWFQSAADIVDIRGHVDVKSVLRKVGDHYMLTMHTDGTVWLPCDRCLQPIALPVSSEHTMVVRPGSEPEEDEHLLIVDERHPVLDLCWLAHEQVILCLPLRCVHDEEQCSGDIAEKLHEYAAEADTDHPHTVDPRWKELEKLKNKPK